MSNDLTSQFIVDEEHVKKNTENLVKKVLKYAKITKSGDIIINEHSLSQDNKVRMCLVVRFLANSLDESIPQYARPVELTKVIGESVESVGSRLSRLSRDGFAKKAKQGQYIVQHYKIETFLEQIETKPGENITPIRVQKTSKKIRKNGQGKRVTSKIGQDIQALVDSGFFKTPKFITEVKGKLEEEVKYHDVRLIDKTIRESFVLSKKILKRIQNEDKGKARWKYVIR